MPVLLLLLGSCGDAEPRSGGSTTQRTRPPASLALTGYRQGTEVAMSGGPTAPYNYGPTVLREGDRYRAWWCSQLPVTGPPGDDILYAQSDRVGGGFTANGGSAVAVFAGRPGNFDAMHTCDPSVLKVGQRYYLYYTGAAGDHDQGNVVGMASSADGFTWRRPRVARPVVTASHEVRRHNAYGVGQPSALHLDGWFYLMFTDTTASDAGWNGAGQFVLRAKNPEFTDQVQSLTDSGFESVAGTDSRRGRSVVDAFSADWMWVDALRVFAIAHQTNGGTRITFWDRGFTRHPYQPVVIPGPWREGPGLLRKHNGHALKSTSDICGTVPIDVVRATVSRPDPTRLRHFGVNVTDVDACGGTPGLKSLMDSVATPSAHRDGTDTRRRRD